MHSALLPILVLGFAPLLWRRTPCTRALAVVATASTLLLGPVLLRPDALPSPSALLGKVAPWREIVDVTQGNPHLGDITHQVEPWLLYLRQEYRSGRWPFWDPFQFSGEPFWSNGSSAPLFPLHLLFAILPLSVGFALLPWLRLVIGGLGAWALARELGVAERPAWLAGIVYPLSGMITSWVLFPMGNAHPFVPWVFWALERFLRGRSSWRPLAGFAALQLLAGHPETPVLTALLGAVYLLARGRDVVTALRTWTGFVGAWAVGLAVAAVQLVPLALTIFASSKWKHHTLPTPVPLDTKLALLSRFLLPDIFGRSGEGTWWGPFNDPATAAYAGALVLPLAILGFKRLGRDPRWKALAVAGVFALLSAYHLLGTGWLLSRLPVLSVTLHHYLRFGVELVLALFAAAGLQRLMGERVLWLPWIAVAAIGTWGALVAGIFYRDWIRLGLLPSATGGLLWALAAALVVALLSGRDPEQRPLRAALPVLVAVAALDLAVAHRPAIPTIPASSLYPRTPAVAKLQELAASGGRVAGLGVAFRPNAGMVFRIPDVRGDSPLKTRRYEEAYAEVAQAHPWFFRPIRRWEHPLLDDLGLRWVLGDPASESPRPDWRLVYDGPDARIWERPGGRALVRWSRGSPEAKNRHLRVVGRRPGRWEIEIAAGAAGKLVVAETWDRGWRASWNGRPSSLVVEGDLLLGIDVPSGPGRLHLVYRPVGLASGLALSILGLLAFPPWQRLRSPGSRQGREVDEP